MIAEVHQALGDVALVDARLLLDGAAFEDQLMAHATACTVINDAVVLLQLCGQVVGVEDGHLGRFCQPIGTHHADIAIGDRQDASATVRRSSHGVEAVTKGNGVGGEEGQQVLSHANRTYTGATAAVRRSEGLVEVQVADVSADRSGVRQTYLGVHVGAVHVELSTAGMHDVAHFLDVCLEDTVRRGVGDHARGQIVAVLLGLGTEVSEVDVSFLVAAYGDGRKAALDGAGGVRTVSRSRQQHHVAVSLSDAFEVRADDTQTGVLARSAGVRLQRDALQTGDLDQCRGEVLDHLNVSGRLIHGSIGVDVLELRTTERQHFRSGIELHRARTQRNHGVSQRDVSALKALDVTHQLGLGVILSEEFLLHELGGAHELLIEVATAVDVVHIGGVRLACHAGKHLQQHSQRLGLRRLVKADAHVTVLEVAQVDVALQCDLAQRLDLYACRQCDLERIEEVLVLLLIAQLLKFFG